MEYSNCNSRQFLFCGWRPWCWGCLNLKLDLAEIWCSHFQGDFGWHVGDNKWPGSWCWWWWYHHYNHDYADVSNDQRSLTTRVKRGGACETTKDCVAGNVCSKYYNKVFWNIFQMLPWISCLLHAMQFVSVNTVILKRWGWCQWTSIYGSDGPSQVSLSLSRPWYSARWQCQRYWP